VVGRRIIRAIKLLFGVREAKRPVQDSGRSRKPTQPQSPKPEDTESPKIHATPAIPTKTGNSRRERLQRELDKGVSLEQRVPNPLGLLGASALLGHRTTQVDVDAWEARVEKLLSGEPRWLSLFRYNEPASPFAHLGLKPLESPLRERLRRRNAQLEKIIRSI
jgi:hypothetical protein